MKAQVRNSGDAHAEPGGLAVTGVLVGDVYLSRPAATARSSYRYQVEQVFPWDLVGREDELAELARFCKAAEGPAYQWWQGPAWAGKSALMAWFVRHPPPGVRLVSFFVTARWFGQSDWTAFLRVVVEQLAEAAGQPMPDLTAEATPAGVFHRLLKAAAASCSQAGERLVLVVDGLDEDRGVTAGPGEHSIAALLPANPPPGVRVLVSGRPDRPVPRDVPSSHPLRSPDVVRPLAVSAQARVIRDDAERELDHLLDDGGPGHDLVGFVATAGGGLTTGDLAELTVLPERTVVRTLRAVTGRTFQRRREGWSTGDVYVLAHEELQRAAVENLGAGERARYLVRLHAWADRYRAAGWPQGTPEYLLRGYVRLLHSQGDLARMTGLATDRARLDRMLDVAGGDAVAFAEIALAQGTVCAQDDPDVAAMLALAASRYRLFLRSSRIPASLPSAWAAVGNMERARTLARSIMSWGGLGGVDVRAIRPLAEMLAEAGDFDGAETFVREEGLSWWLDLAPLLAGLVAAGRYDRVEALAVDIPGWFPDLSAVLADAFVAAGELDRAQRAVRSIDDPEVLALPVVRVARALAQADRTQEARSLAAWAADVFTPGSGPEAAASEEERAEQIRLLAVVATAMVAADDGDNARRLAARIEEFGYGGKNNRLHALARLLPLWRDLGEPGEVARIRNLVERELHGGGYLLTDYAAPGLVAMVRGLIELGDLDEARRVLRPAWDGALRNLERRYPFLGSGPLLDLMRVLPDLGEHERLDGIVHEIDDQEYRDEALEVRAELHAAEEAFEQACVTGRLIADPVRQEGLLSRLVPRLIEAQEFDLVESVLSALSDPSHREQARDALAEALAASGAWDRAAALVELVPWHRRAEPLLHLANLAPDEDKPVWGRRALAALEESDAHWPEVLRLVLTAEALAAAREPEAASRTADEAGELLRTLLKLPPRLRLSRWTELLGAAARSLGDPVRGLAYAHEAGALADSLPDVAERASALEELAGTLLDVGLADEGAAVAERIPDDQMRSALLTRVFAEALASGATDRAERYAQPAFDAAQAIHHPWAQAQALAGLAAVARDAGWLADGAVIAGAIEEPGARTAALAEVVHAQARAGEGEGARALVAEAEAAARSYFDPLVLARAATRTAAVWAAAGATDEALEHAWTADRAALRIADLWDRCAILSELARTDRALGDAATAQAYAEAVDALTRAVAAPALLAGLQSTAAEAWLAAGMPDRAEEAVMALAAAVPAGQEGADGQPGDAESDERSRAELVELFLDAGELDRAARVAAAFPCPDGDAGAREPLARAWLAAGELDRAAEVVQPHTAAAVALVRAYAAAGDGATAGALAERIESAARAVTNESIDPGKNPWADAMVWSVRAWAAAGETERAAGLARTVEQTVLDRTVRSPLARMPLFHALVKAGELDEAEEVGAAFPDACDRVQALTDLARVRVTGGDLPRARGHAEAAESLVQAMCEPGDEASAPPSEFSLNHARSRVVEAFSALGDLDHARMLADGITDEHALASARTSIALRLIADGDLEAAEAVLAELADVYRDRHLPELMDAWAAAGDPGRARMIGEAAAGPALRSPYGNWLVRQAMAEGDEPRAQALAERMEAAARTVDLSDRADALRSVCSAWLTLGDLARAEAVADTVPSTALQIAARCEVALAYQDQGDETAARRRLTAVGAGERDARDNPELHEWSVERLAAAWAALGDFEQALAVAESARWPQQRASAIASLARLATPPRSRRLLCRALAVHIDYREIIYTVVALAPEAVAAVAAVRDL